METNKTEKQNKDKVQKSSFKTIIIVVVIIIVLILVVIITNSMEQKSKTTPIKPVINQEHTSDLETDIDEEDGDIVDELNLTEELSVEAMRLQEAEVEVVGGNPVLDGVVLSHAGEIARNDLKILDEGAPQASGPVSKESLPKSTKLITVTAEGFNPNSFEVSPGEVVTIALEPGDMSHTLTFDDSSLSAISVGAMKGEIRTITFNAPTKAGEYTFRCTMYNHDKRGEVGTMIVR